MSGEENLLEPNDVDMSTELDDSDDENLLEPNDVDMSTELDDSDDEAAAATAEVDLACSPPQAPYVLIVEQPTKAVGFKYKSVNSSPNAILGVSSSYFKQTYPTIKVCGYTGKAVIVVSCVTKDAPYKPHPHNLVGRECCSSGVCRIRVDLHEGSQVIFNDIGVQCATNIQVHDWLTKREEEHVDPFKTGFGHKNQPKAIARNAVRLCFEVFLVDDCGKLKFALDPVVSNVIRNQTAQPDLEIEHINQLFGPMKGGNELMLMCKKIHSNDIAVVVVSMKGQQQNEKPAEVTMIHKQVAISFIMPPYDEPSALQEVVAHIQLKRPSDDARSNRVKYRYVPCYQGDRSSTTTSVAPPTAGNTFGDYAFGVMNTYNFPAAPSSGQLTQAQQEGLVSVTFNACIIAGSGISSDKTFIAGFGGETSTNFPQTQTQQLLTYRTGEPSVADWQALVSGISRQHQRRFAWFEKALQNLTNEERANLLLFTTGCSQPPPGGLQALQPRFEVTLVPSLGGLPTAQRSINQLCLPAYNSYDEFFDALRFAINSAPSATN